MKRQFEYQIKKHISINLFVLLTKLLVLITIFILVSSCTRKDDFTIGDNFIESSTKLSIIDTFRVDLSTVLVDSLITSGTGIAFTGKYTDKTFGSVSSDAYFEPGYTTAEIPDNAVFDSAVVILTYSGYSYGDTSSLMSVSLYRLNERITLNTDNNLYNRSHFAYSDTVLGSISFYPDPHSSDSVRIPVNIYGGRLFELFKNKDLNVSTSDIFLNYVNGFVLKSDYGNSILGFFVSSDHTFLKFYYHLTDLNITKSVISIPFGVSVSRQFNSVQNDFTGSDLDSIKASRIAVSSYQTGDMAFLQAMTGLLPKVTFPTLQNIFMDTRWKVLKAELVVDPVKGSYEEFALPKQLCLYYTDKYNRVGAVLSDANKSTILSTLTIDNLYNEKTIYTIDVTSFITAQLSNGYFNNETGLFIGLQSSEINKKFDRLQIECKNPSVKLKIYYLNY